MTLLPVLSLLVCLCASAAAQRARGEVVRSSVNAFIVETDHYPFDTCLVSGKALEKSATVLEVEGRTFKVCSEECKAKVTADPKPWMAKLDAAVIAAQDPHYPVTDAGRLQWRRCPSCWQDINAGDGPFHFVTKKNVLVKVCSKQCCETLAKDDDLATRRLLQHDTALRAYLAGRSATYTAKTCPVSGRELGAKAVLVRHGLTLVKLCCEDCVAEFRLTPNTLATKVKQGGTKKGKGKDSDVRENQGGVEAAKPPVKRQDRSSGGRPGARATPQA